MPFAEMEGALGRRGGGGGKFIMLPICCCCCCCWAFGGDMGGGGGGTLKGRVGSLWLFWYMAGGCGRAQQGRGVSASCAPSWLMISKGAGVLVLLEQTARDTRPTT